MNNGICHIVGAADFAAAGFTPGAGDLVIACDAGLLSLEKIGVKPDLILGDFDSLGEVPRGDNVIRHRVRKDDTDAYLALEEGLARGYRRFILRGCTGGARFDHTVANLQTLIHAAQSGAYALICAPDFTATVLKGAVIRFGAGYAGDLSVFAVGGDAVVSETGLDYEADRVTLTPGRPVGVSNSFKGRDAAITVWDGTALIIWDGPSPDGFPEISRVENED